MYGILWKRTKGNIRINTGRIRPFLYAEKLLENGAGQ